MARNETPDVMDDLLSEAKQPQGKKKLPAITAKTKMVPVQTQIPEEYRSAIRKHFKQRFGLSEMAGIRMVLIDYLSKEIGIEEDAEY